MVTKNDIVEIIFNCIEDINKQNNSEIPKSLNTNLYGSKSDLDSIGLVNLIVNVEEAINDKYDISISIADERAMSKKNSPFKNIDTIANYILELFEEKL